MHAPGLAHDGGVGCGPQWLGGGLATSLCCTHPQQPNLPARWCWGRAAHAQAYRQLQEAGLPDTFLDAVAAGLLPSGEAVCAMPNALVALCLNQSGLERVQVGAGRLIANPLAPQRCGFAHPGPRSREGPAAGLAPLGIHPAPPPTLTCAQDTCALAALLPIMTGRRYARALAGDAPTVLGSGLEELLRFVPQLRPAGVDVMVAVLRGLAILGGACFAAPWAGAPGGGGQCKGQQLACA